MIRKSIKKKDNKNPIYKMQFKKVKTGTSNINIFGSNSVFYKKKIFCVTFDFRLHQCKSLSGHTRLPLIKGNCRFKLINNLFLAGNNISIFHLLISFTCLDKDKVIKDDFIFKIWLFKDNYNYSSPGIVYNNTAIFISFSPSANYYYL